MTSLLGFFKWHKLQKQEMQLQNTAIGMNSTVDKDKHIVMLDYDEKDFDKVMDSVIELQEFWNLADAYLYQTRNGHHVFFFEDQVPYGRLKMIIEFARYVDPMYKYISKYYNHKTIRVAGKYADRDIFYIGKIEGRRIPTDEEKEIGELKRNEHKLFIEQF